MLQVAVTSFPIPAFTKLVIPKKAIFLDRVAPRAARRSFMDLRELGEWMG